MVFATAVSPEEAVAGCLSPDKLSAMADAFARSGLAVLADVIPHAVLDAAAAQLDYDAARIIADGLGGSSGRGASGESDDTFGGKGAHRPSPLAPPKFGHFGHFAEST